MFIWKITAPMLMSYLRMFSRSHLWLAVICSISLGQVSCTADKTTSSKSEGVATNDDTSEGYQNLQDNAQNKQPDESVPELYSESPATPATKKDATAEKYKVNTSTQSETNVSLSENEPDENSQDKTSQNKQPISQKDNTSSINEETATQETIPDHQKHNNVLAEVLAMDQPDKDSPFFDLFTDVQDLQLKKGNIVIEKHARYPCELLHWVFKISMSTHVNHRSSRDFSLDFVKKSLKHYMEYLDQEKIYFSKKDEDFIMNHLAHSLKSELVENSCHSIELVAEIYMKRFIDRLPMVYKNLVTNHDFSKKEYLFRPEKRDYVDSFDALSDRVRKIIKFRYKVKKVRYPKENFADHANKVALPFHLAAQKVKTFSTFQTYDAYLTTLSYLFDSHTNFLNHEKQPGFLGGLTDTGLVGIGVRLNITEDELIITDVISGGSARRDGTIQPEDIILGVRQDGADEQWEYTKDTSFDYIMSRIRGEIDTTVHVKVKRLLSDLDTSTEDENETKDVTDSSENTKTEKSFEIIDVTLVRDHIKPENILNLPFHHVPVETTLREKPVKVGYLVFEQFYNNSIRNTGVADDISAAVKNMIDDGVESLVIDLRNNGGGLLGSALWVISLFMDAPVGVYERGRNFTNHRKDSHPTFPSFTQSIFHGTDPNRRSVINVYPFTDIHPSTFPKIRDQMYFYDLPIVVMVEGGTASAAEILAQAIKVNGRGIIVGDKHTSGKGSVQRVLRLPYQKFQLDGEPIGSAVKVTVAQFFGADGKSIQDVGVESDILLPSPGFFGHVFAKEDKHSIPYSELDPKYAQNLTLDFRNPNIVSALRDLSTSRRLPDSLYGKMIDWFLKSEHQQMLEDMEFKTMEKVALYFETNDLKEEITEADNFMKKLNTLAKEYRLLTYDFEDTLYEGDRTELFYSMMEKDYALKEAVHIAADYFVLCRGDQPELNEFDESLYNPSQGCFNSHEQENEF